METNPLHQLIAQRMKALRLTDQNVADEMGDIGTPVSRAFVTYMRNGKKMPRIENGKALCQVLGITPARLLEAAENQARQRKAQA